MAEAKLTKTKAGSYRIYIPRLMVEEMFGVKESCKVDILCPEPGKLTIYKKEDREELIDVDEDVEVVE